jgi:precorrin-6B methylase 2
MYSSAIYDAVKAPSNQTGLVFRGSLEEAQWRKLDTLLDRAQVQPEYRFLDIGFGWGGLSLHAVKKYGCQVHGITLSVEQKALAEERVKIAGLGDLITFEVIDYRVFARRKENQGRFDRVISCEMIEVVGHNHLGEFYWAVEQVLSHDGILVMEAITTPEARYESYLRSTDFINTIIFPGGCCPSLHALIIIYMLINKLTSNIILLYIFFSIFINFDMNDCMAQLSLTIDNENKLKKNKNIQQHSPQDSSIKTKSKVPSDMGMLEAVGERKLLLPSVLELVIEIFFKTMMKLLDLFLIN